VACGLTAGIKDSAKTDLALLVSELPAVCAATFTTNKVRAACVNWCQFRADHSGIKAIICNSGNANACTGERGERDNAEMAHLVAQHLGCKPEQVLVASTGVIGEFLPIDKCAMALSRFSDHLDSGTSADEAFSYAILTTDIVAKRIATKCSLSGGDVRIGATAKGSGMIHPNMATMLAFITTDVKIEQNRLQKILSAVVDDTFNLLTVDGDTSTNDMVLMLANGASGIAVQSSEDERHFTEALYKVCDSLAAQIAADGEGATKHVLVRVEGAADQASARIVARSVAGSNLVKTALFGNDPNWGRILAAVGYSGSDIEPDKLVISIQNTPVFRKGTPVAFDEAALSKQMAAKKVTIKISLGLGEVAVTAHTCDFSYDYVRINAEYHT